MEHRPTKTPCASPIEELALCMVLLVMNATQTRSTKDEAEPQVHGQPREDNTMLLSVRCLDVPRANVLRCASGKLEQAHVPG